MLSQILSPFGAMESCNPVQLVLTEQSQKHERYELDLGWAQMLIRVRGDVYVTEALRIDEPLTKQHQYRTASVQNSIGT